MCTLQSPDLSDYVLYISSELSSALPTSEPPVLYLNRGVPEGMDSVSSHNEVHGLHTLLE